jgi:transforming growth factor-beta-induced protein
LVHASTANIYQLDNQMTSMRLVGTSGNGVVNAIDRLIVPPWLRVASGPRLAAPERSSFANELDLGAPEARPAPATAPPPSSLNLPLLNNRPLSFEQPPVVARLSPSSSSFSLAGSAGGAPSGPGSDGFDALPSARTAPQPLSLATNSLDESPFLRLANNISQSGPSSWPQALAGARLQPTSDHHHHQRQPPTAAPLNSLAGPADSNSQLTKNMQLIEKLAGLMKVRKFVKYLFKSRLSERLKPDMNYVILVPTDQAIERLPKQIIDVLDKDLERLSDLVNFHVLDTTFEYINTIPDGQTLNTLNEKDILFNWHRNNTILTASGAVVLGGIQEENIALLIVDRVLYPTPGDLLSIVTKSPILSNFTNLIRSAGLEQQLRLNGPFTLFAPSDFAFNQLDKRDLDFLQHDHESARRLLLRHLSQPAIFTSSIALSNATEKSPAGANSTAATVPLMSVTNSLGEELTLRQKNDYFSVNDVNFSYADVAATNGVVHVIDGLL